MKKVSKMVVVMTSLVLAVGLSACGKGNQTKLNQALVQQVR